jgi:hypothetical protein
LLRSCSTVARGGYCPALRVSPHSLRSFFDNSIFCLSTPDRPLASIRPAANFHDLTRGRA